MSHRNTSRLRTIGILFITLRAALILWVATLSQYETDPHRLALFGLCGIFGQLLLRFAGYYIFNEDEDESDDESDFLWPNMTQAQAIVMAEFQEDSDEDDEDK